MPEDTAPESREMVTGRAAVAFRDPASTDPPPARLALRAAGAWSSPLVGRVLPTGPGRAWMLHRPDAPALAPSVRDEPTVG